MAANITVFEPTAPYRSEGQQQRLALDTLNGKVVGFVDDTKQNFNYLVDDLAELLQSRYGVKSTVKHRKRGPSVPASNEVFEDLVAQCDLVITGSGD